MSPLHLNRGRVLYNNFILFTKVAKHTTFYTSSLFSKSFQSSKYLSKKITALSALSELPE
jgi:hypothetical protein